MKLKALKTFSRGGGKLVKQGQEFEANKAHAQEYIRLNLATPIDAQADAQALEGGQVDAQTIPESDYTENELLDLTVSKLKEIAKNIGVSGYSGMSKSELVFAILAKQKSNQQQMEG